MPDPFDKKFDADLEKLMEMLGPAAPKEGPAPGGAPPPPSGPPPSVPPPGAAPPPGVPPAPPGAGPLPPAPEGKPFAFEPVAPPPVARAQASLDMLKDVPVHVKVELGRARLRVQDVLGMGPGSIVELDRLTGDPLDLYVNGILVARGEVLIINENFALRVTEVISPEPAKPAS